MSRNSGTDWSIIYVLQIALDRFPNLLDFIGNKKKGIFSEVMKILSAKFLIAASKKLMIPRV